MKTFTERGATTIHNEFIKLCEQFAKENGITFNGARLTWGDTLKFSVGFGIKENEDAEWDHWVEYFKNEHSIDLKKGMSFKSGRKTYTLTGGLNPSKRSRFVFDVTDNSTGDGVRFSKDGLIEALKGE